MYRFRFFKESYVTGTSNTFDELNISLLSQMRKVAVDNMCDCFVIEIPNDYDFITARTWRSFAEIRDLYILDSEKYFIEKEGNNTYSVIPCNIIRKREEDGRYLVEYINNNYLKYKYVKNIFFDTKEQAQEKIDELVNVNSEIYSRISQLKKMRTELEEEILFFKPKMN